MPGTMTQLPPGSGGFILNISSGGVVTRISGAQAILSAPGSGAVAMLLSSGASISLGTTISANANEAYQQFLTDKRNAMTTGGTATLNGVSQVFSGGYLEAVSATRLMSLNGVRGYPSSGSCNLNFNPTEGFWVEPQNSHVIVSGGSVVDSGGTVAMRTRVPCVTCDDYNNIFALEMVIYHKLNNIAWQIMRRDDVPPLSPGEYVDGIWPRYQGLVAAWNFYVYKSEYLVYNASLRESLNVNIGWSNPSCEPAGFVCVADVTRTITGTDYGAYGLIFYLGTMLTPGTTKQDNNRHTAGNPLPFILSYPSSGGGLLFCGGNIADSDVKSSLQTEMASAVGSGYTESSYTSICNMISSATVITDVQQFASAATNAGKWKLGLVGANIGGMGYATQNFGLGVAVSLTNYAPTPAKLDTYEIRTEWWIKCKTSGSITVEPVILSDTPQTLTTYGLTTA